MGFILGLICIVLIITGLVNFIYYRGKEKEFYKATGTIIANEEFQDRSRKGAALSMYYYPVVEYQDRDGNMHQIVSEDCNIDLPMYPVGTVIDLLVNPNDCTSILFDTDTDKRQVPLICVSTGGIGLVLILCFYLFSPPARPARAESTDFQDVPHDTVFNQLPQPVKDSIEALIKRQ